MNRETQRVEWALQSIQRQAELHLKSKDTFERLRGLQHIRDLVSRALQPPRDEIVLATWQRGDIGEGEAHRTLGVSREEARQMLRSWWCQHSPEWGVMEAEEEGYQMGKFADGSPYHQVDEMAFDEAWRRGKARYHEERAEP